MNLPVLSDSLLETFLAEDVAVLDLTTHVLGIGARAAQMSFSARAAMTLAGIEEAARIVTLAGGTADLRAASGAALPAGALLLAAKGPAGALLRAWKVAQTLVETASGIATAAAAIVAAARAANPKIAVACTRKNAPGTKLLALKAILAGGAVPHRLGLAESILIFPEHRAFFEGMTAEAAIAAFKTTAPEKKIVVEVTDVAAALAWADAGADVLQTEKFSAAAVAEVAQALRGRPASPLLAAAGGINAENAAAYAAAGADILVTSAPYWAKPGEVAVRIDACGQARE
jgi:molybdenum transport protein